MTTPAEFSWPLISFPPPPPSDITGAPNLGPGQTTLTDLIRIIRQRTDTVNNDVVTDDELTDWIRLSANELYDLLIGAYEDYAVRLPPFELRTDGTTDYYALPQDLYKLLGVDWQPTSGTLSTNVSLRRFNMGERNRYSRAFLPPAPGCAPCRYKLLGDNRLWLSPRAPANMTLLVYYAPRLRPLSNVGAITLSFSNPGAVPLDSVIGITRSTAAGESDGGVTWTAKAADLGPGTFQVDFTSLEQTAINLAAAINRDVPPSIYKAYVVGRSVGVVLQSPASLLITGSSPGYLINPNYVFTNVLDAVSGWEQYVISDVGAQVQQKQDMEATLFLAQKNALKARIEKIAANRDVGSPAVVTDVYAENGPWGGGWEYGSGWGGG